MDYALVERNIRAAYRNVCPRYRQDDELEVMTENHQRLAETLREISLSFNRPISVLDAGCGTGRYFHCVQNVDLLIGIDLCPEMLEAARTPVRCEDVQAKNIRLLCENVHQASFPRETFDFIYSLGMFGNGCPLTAALCNRFHEWLAPDGKLFFNTINYACLPFHALVRKKLRRAIYQWLPRRWKALLDERAQRLPFFPLTKTQLQEIVRRSRFRKFELINRACESPLWRGTHLECTAWKTD